MEITEVRIKLMEEPGERLKAFCSITFDNCFVVRDLKIIDGSNGPFVAMPSRKLTAHCPGCGMKNHLRAQYCNQCGKKLSDTRAPKDAEGRAKLYADIAHPINSFCREMIQDVVVSEYYEEIERASNQVTFRATMISISSTAMRRGAGQPDSIRHIHVSPRNRTCNMARRVRKYRKMWANRSFSARKQAAVVGQLMCRPHPLIRLAQASFPNEMRRKSFRVCVYGAIDPKSWMDECVRRTRFTWRD